MWRAGVESIFVPSPRLIGPQIGPDDLAGGIDPWAGSPARRGALPARSRRRGAGGGLWGCRWAFRPGSRVDLVLVLAVVVLLAATVLVAVALTHV